MRPDGEPSPTLERRIAVAMAAASADPDALVLGSGAVGRHGPSEARVIAARLEPHVASDRILLDEQSRDTLESVLAAARIVRGSQLRGCVACSDGYHVPRIRILFRMLGVRVKPAPVGWRGGTWPYWLWMCCREVAAIPRDVVRLAWRRGTLVESRP